MNKTILLTLLLCLPFCVRAGVETNSKGKWGYSDEKGNLIIAYQYDFIGAFSENGLALVKKGKNFGMVNRDGKMVLPVVYSQIVPFSQDRMLIIQKGKTGMADMQGTILHAPEYMHILPFNSDGLAIAVVKKNGGKDLLNSGNMTAILHKSGKELARGTAGSLAQLTGNDNKVTALSELYVDTINTASGYFCNKTTNVIYDINGSVVLDNNIRTTIYQAVFGSATTLANRHPSLTNSEGIPHCDVINFAYSAYVDNNTAKICVGYFNLKTQKLLYHFTATSTRKYNSKTGKYFFSPNGATVSCRNFNDGVGIARIKNNGADSGDFVIDTEGNVVSRFLSDHSFDSQYGYMVAARGSKYGLWDTKTGQFSIQPMFPGGMTAISRFGNWAVKNDSAKWGVLDVHGDTIVPFEYENIIQKTHGNFFGVLKDDKWGVYAHNRQIMECVCDTVLAATPNSVVFNKWDWQYNEYSYGTYYERHVDEIYSIYWSHADSISYFDGYETVYEADSVYHNGYIWLMSKSNAKGWPVYGAVNNYGEEVIPFIFDTKELVEQAIGYYKDKPVQHFTKADCRRLLLYVGRKNDQHSLYSEIPLTSWDY